MKTTLKTVDDHGVIYTALMFVCPGCLSANKGTGLHMLPVNTTNKNPSWDWDGSVDTPTLSPSILTRSGDDFVCHSFLRNGKFEFLTDSTHPLSGQTVDIPDLPTWTYEEDADDD